MPQITTYTALLRAGIDATNDQLAIVDVSTGNLVCRVSPVALVGAALDSGIVGIVSSFSFTNANGFTGTVLTASSTPALTLGVSLTGVLKGTGTALAVANGTDLPAMTNLLAGAVPTPPNDGTKFLSGLGTWLVPNAAAGTVTAVTVVSANGLAGSVATNTTTPAITLSTTVAAGMVKSSGTAFIAATSGTDFAPGTSALATGIIKSTTVTGALTIATGADLPSMTATVGGAVPTPPNDATKFLSGAGTWLIPAGSGTGTVTTVSVVSANGFAGTVATAASTPAITITTTITGLLKGNGTAISAATAGTDYSAGTSALGTGILKSTTVTGALTIATGADLPVMTATVGGAVPTPPNLTTQFLRGDGTWATPAGAGTVTSVSVVSANGFAGTVATATSTPAITLTTTITGLLKGNGTAISAATVRTDYAEPTGALATGILKNTTGTGAHSIAVAADFPTLNQNTTGSAATLTTARLIYGNSFNGSADLTGVISATFGGTGNGFTQFTGPTTATKTFTLPNASATILTDNSTVTVAQGGIGVASLTAFAPLFGGTTTTGPVQSGTVGTAGQVLTSNGAGALPTFQTAAAGISNLVKSGRTVNTIIGAGDKGTVITITGAGGITQTYTAAATLGSGFWTYYKNDSTGVVTHDANLSETFTDGLNAAVTLAQQPGECWLIQCDGAGFNIIRVDKGTANYLLLQERQTAGTASSDSVLTTSLSTRTLNTVVNNTIPGASLASNEFTLPAGSYRINARAPISQQLSTQRAFNIALVKTPSGTPVVVLTGDGISASAGSGGSSRLVTELSGKFTVTTAAAYAIQQITSSASTDSGGLGLSLGTLAEIYTSVEIWKEA